MNARKVNREEEPFGRWIVGELAAGTRRVRVFARYATRAGAEWHLGEIQRWETPEARRVVLDSQTLEVEFRIPGDFWCPKWGRTCVVSPNGWCSECSDQHGEIPIP